MPRKPKKASQLATALIEHSSDAIALVDEGGTVLYANPATGWMLGKPIAEVIGSNVFGWVHRDDLLVPYKATVDERFERWMTQQKRAGVRFSSEQRQWLELIRDRHD